MNITESSIPAAKGVIHTQRCRTARLGDVLPLKYGKARSEQFGYDRPETVTYGSNGAFGKFPRALTNGPAIIVGRKGAAGAVHFSAEPCWPIDTAFYTEGRDDINLPFFYYLLQCLQLGQLDRSTAIPSLSRDDYSSTVIHYPESIDEQHRIVAEIEQQFTRLDAGVAALRRTQANLKRYRAAVLKAACEGCLVPTEAELARTDGRSYESGEHLLARILSERQKNWKGRGKYKTPDALNWDGLAKTPEGWTWGSSSQILREVKDGTHDTPTYHAEGIPFITQKHIKPAGLVFDDYKFIAKEDHDHFHQRSNPERGDILVSMIGVNRGESCIIDRDDIFSIKNVGLFKPNHTLSSAKFIQYYFSSRLGQQLILKQSKGGAQPFIGLTELRAWPIPLPPLAEQIRIVAEVERRLSVVDELESVVKANLQRAARLQQSILHFSFKTNE